MSEQTYHNYVPNHNGVFEYSNVDFNDYMPEFDEGMAAAQAGKQKSSCPYKGRKRTNWIGGWETCCLDGEFAILEYKGT
jgi:ribosome modulation factor